MTSLYSNKIIDTVCKHIYKREFIEAERYILSYIEMIMKDDTASISKRTDDIEMLNQLYANFNSLYYSYISRVHANEGKEVDELFSSEHDNLFIAHCKEPADMDDLLYETLNYLMDTVGHTQEEVYKHIEYYRKTISQ